MPGKVGADKLLTAMEQEASKCLQAPKLQQLVRWADFSTQSSDKSSKPSARKLGTIFLSRILSLPLSRPLLIHDLSYIHSLSRALVHDRKIVHDRKLSSILSRVYGFTIGISRSNDRSLHLSPKNSHTIAREFKDADIFTKVDFDELLYSLNALSEKKQKSGTSKAARKKIVGELYELWFSALGLDSQTAMLSKPESQSLADYFYICELMIRCKEGATRVSPEVWEGIEARILTVPATSETSAD